jgi:hypothetical protein
MLAFIVTDVDVHGPLGAAQRTLAVFATGSDPHVRTTAQAAGTPLAQTVALTSRATLSCVRRRIRNLAVD